MTTSQVRQKAKAAEEKKSEQREKNMVKGKSHENVCSIWKMQAHTHRHTYAKRTLLLEGAEEGTAV